MKQDRVIECLYRTHLNTVYEWGCDAYVDRSDDSGAPPYHVHLMLTKIFGTEDYQVTGSCNCPAWRIAPKDPDRKETWCKHMDASFLRWRQDQRKGKGAG